jgi:hypothetical protein
VFAGEKNEHNMDPRNFGGDVIDMQYRGPGADQGTWALIEADKAAAKEIRRNPRLGVSARIKQAINKSDGRTFKRAVNHVLLTMNPRVSTEPWQAVDLSEETDKLVVDLTAVEFKEGKQMAKKVKTATVTVPRDADGNIDLSELDTEAFEGLLDLAAAVAEDERLGDYVEDAEDGDDEPEVRKTKKKKSKTKVTVEKESEEDDDEDDDDDADDEDEDTDLSESLTQDEVDDLRALRSERAAERWETERAKLSSKGDPPFMLDLAEPVMSSVQSMTIDLSDDETVDARKVIKSMLEKSVGLVDLSEEEGHMLDLSDVQSEKFEGQDLYEAWEIS